MWLILALIALPLIEIALFVVIGGAIGLWATLAWVVLTAVLGFLILKRVARLGSISFERDVKALGDPQSTIASRALTIMAAGLLILPGFFTDTVGFLLLLMPVQGLIISIFSKRFHQSGAVQQGSVTIDGVWGEVEHSQNDSHAPGQNPGQPPSGFTRH